MDGNPRQQLLEKLKSSNNILVTVSNNPSVDQLAACIALTLLLNKLNKHATAVFSGAVPSTIEFLKPSETLESNTDSLRDFIIALDKSKADKLRYKVEDKVVKIFITPYRTSISENDLEFSQGDFNVDVVVALGVRDQRDLDQAITAHGRILHDATVATINTSPDGGLGSINWHDVAASSLSEMVEQLSGGLGEKLLDGQIATSLLTGIVAETNRFSNDRTTASTMTVSAELMAAGANQQLVANKLQGNLATASPNLSQNVPNPGAGAASVNPPQNADDGTLAIPHGRGAESFTPPVPSSNNVPGLDQPADHRDEDTDIDKLLQQISAPVSPNEPTPEPSRAPPSRPLTINPPSMGGTLSANTSPEILDPSTDPMSLPPVDQPLLNHYKPPTMTPNVPPLSVQTGPANVPQTPLIPVSPLQQSPQDAQSPAWIKTGDDQTLIDLEEAVNSPHIEQEAAVLDNARSAVAEALNTSIPAGEVSPPRTENQTTEPIQATPSTFTPYTPPQPPQPAASAPQVFIDNEGNFHQSSPVPPTATNTNEPAPMKTSPADQPLTMPLPTSFGSPLESPNPTPPPPVPPPMVPLPFANPTDPAQSR